MGTMDQIDRDIREGTFPKKSAAALREQASELRPMSEAPKDGTHILAYLYTEPDDFEHRGFGEWREIWWKPYQSLGMNMPWHAGDPFDSHTHGEEPEHFGEGVPIAWLPLPPRQAARGCVNRPFMPPGPHQWTERFGFTMCASCGYVRRHDDKNKPCRGPVYMRDLEGVTMKRSFPKRLPVEALAHEIGARYEPEHETRAFQICWVKRMALVVSGHAWPSLHKYPASIRKWADEIWAADVETMDATLSKIHEEIHAVDYDDGWATDRAGAAMESVCLALLPDTRWMANAAQHVWRFATGCASYNDIARFSQDAWLQKFYADTCAEVRANITHASSQNDAIEQETTRTRSEPSGTIVIESRERGEQKPENLAVIRNQRSDDNS